MYFSKSKYCEFMQCSKSAWLTKYKPYERKVDEHALAIMSMGNEVGDLAMGLFGDYVEVTVLKEDGTPDIPQMIERTKEELEKGTQVICEASFDYNGLYCAVDLLKKTNNGYSIYEVKSSMRYDKAEYLYDVAYQKTVLTKCGIKVDRVYLVYLNGAYERKGEIDLNYLFNVEDMTYRIDQVHVESDIAIAKAVLENETEPDVELSPSCKKPHLCPYWEYCTKALPKPSVFDLYGTNFNTKLKLYKEGVVSFFDVKDTKEYNHKIRALQVDMNNKDGVLHVNKRGIQNFLATLSYPMYFLDFETMMPAIPIFDGTRCYQQIPFQYSLHYIEREGGEVLHKEFLAESGKDPREEIARKLCEDIPENACVLAYNKSFEGARITELADSFPRYAEHLLKVSSHLVDLITPFLRGDCYNKAMGNSFSIKSVLPALYPFDASLDYKTLDGVHNGSEAMNVFPKLATMSKEEAKKYREALLAYCKLDTFAMVKIWEKLIELSK